MNVPYCASTIIVIKECLIIPTKKIKRLQESLFTRHKTTRRLKEHKQLDCELVKQHRIDIQSEGHEAFLAKYQRISGTWAQRRDWPKQRRWCKLQLAESRTRRAILLIFTAVFKLHIQGYSFLSFNYKVKLF